MGHQGGASLGLPEGFVKERVAVVGSGIAGMGAAWNLRDRAELTIFEKQSRPGGHTNTVVVREEGREVPIDTGFIVFNHATYPHLVRLFKELGVPVQPAEMSFSVHDGVTGLEYNGMGLDKLFAQRSNLWNPRFYRMVADILRFFSVANAALNNPSTARCTILEFARLHGLGSDFLNFYLIPMGSAVWSTEPGRMLDFPALSLIRFFKNHGFLGVSTHHPWFTVSGGSRCYRDRLLAALAPVRLPAEVVEVRQEASRASIRTACGELLHFDRVVLATHADEALAMLPGADADQQRLLGAFRYQKNTATLHTHAAVMPERRRAWASWNYRLHRTTHGDRVATTHYWMNALQRVSRVRDYFVSINGRALVPDDCVLYETTYDHPVFTLEAMDAQAGLSTLNQRGGDQRVFFCGSYFRHGFHEDAYWSAVELAAILRPILRG